MRLRFRPLMLLIALLLSLPLALGLTPAGAQAPATARTLDFLRLRVGPGTEHAILTTLPPHTPLIIEGRSAGAEWVLAHTDSGLRGWVSRDYLAFLSGAGQALPISAEQMPTPTPAPVSAPPPAPAPTGLPPANISVNYDAIDMDGFNPATVARIDLNAYPVIARLTPTARAAFWRGAAMGRNARFASKVGDCFSAHEYYLNHFGWDKYHLGAYGTLQGVVDYYHDSLAARSYASSVGFVAGAVMDSTWSDPSMCQPEESPLECEYRVNNPSIALIMFGTQDVRLMSPRLFDGYLREVVEQTLEANIVPVLSTFPGNLELWDKTILYNQIVVRIALDYDVPLINLWLALEALPNHGLDIADNLHLSFPVGEPGDLSPENLQTGYGMRNLVTLQSLDALWRGLRG